MRYVEARCRLSDREEAYRIYMTEGMKAIAGMNTSYYKLIDTGVEETRSKDEIINNISQKLAKMGESK